MTSSAASASVLFLFWISVAVFFFIPALFTFVCIVSEVRSLVGPFSRCAQWQLGAGWLLGVMDKCGSHGGDVCRGRI